MLNRIIKLLVIIILSIVALYVVFCTLYVLCSWLFIH